MDGEVRSKMFPQGEGTGQRRTTECNNRNGNSGSRRTVASEKYDVEEGMSYRRYRIIYDFEERTPENIKETLPVLLLRHVMQQVIILEEGNEADIGYSNYEISGFQYRFVVRFYKYSLLHPMVAGHEEDRYKEVGVSYSDKNRCKIKFKK